MNSIGWLDRLAEILSKPSRRTALRCRRMRPQSAPSLIELLEIRKCPAIVTPTLGGVSGTGTYFENSAPISIAPTLTCTNVIVGGLGGVNNIASATVTFTNWQGEDRLNFNNIFALQHSFGQDLSAHTAILTITGSDTPDHYQTLLRSVIYWNVSDAPNVSARVATFTVTSDPLAGSGTTLDSNSVTRSIAVSATNDAPLLRTWKRPR